MLSMYYSIGYLILNTVLSSKILSWKGNSRFAFGTVFIVLITWFNWSDRQTSSVILDRSNAKFSKNIHVNRIWIANTTRINYYLTVICDCLYFGSATWLSFNDFIFFRWKNTHYNIAPHCWYQRKYGNEIVILFLYFVIFCCELLFVSRSKEYQGKMSKTLWKAF